MTDELAAAAPAEPRLAGASDRSLRELARYFLVSVAALCVDTATLLIAAGFMHHLLAASLGFALGALVAYLLSVRWVFRRRRLRQFPRRELAVFVVVGLLGLAVNAAVIQFMVTVVATGLLPAKLAAAGATFSFNFLVRRGLLF